MCGQSLVYYNRIAIKPMIVLVFTTACVLSAVLCQSLAYCPNLRVLLSTQSLIQLTYSPCLAIPTMLRVEGVVDMIGSITSLALITQHFVLFLCKFNSHS